jgi:hypothetical protein
MVQPAVEMLTGGIASRSLRRSKSRAASVSGTQLDRLRAVNQKAEMSTTIPITTPEKNGESSDDSWSFVALFGPANE